MLDFVWTGLVPSPTFSWLLVSSTRSGLSSFQSWLSLSLTVSVFLCFFFSRLKAAVSTNTQRRGKAEEHARSGIWVRVSVRIKCAQFQENRAYDLLELDAADSKMESVRVRGNTARPTVWMMLSGIVWRLIVSTCGPCSACNKNNLRVELDSASTLHYLFPPEAFSVLHLFHASFPSPSPFSFLTGSRERRL